MTEEEFTKTLKESSLEDDFTFATALLLAFSVNTNCALARALPFILEGAYGLELNKKTEIVELLVKSITDKTARRKIMAVISITAASEVILND